MYIYMHIDIYIPIVLYRYICNIYIHKEMYMDIYFLDIF